MLYLEHRKENRCRTRAVADVYIEGQRIMKIEPAVVFNPLTLTVMVYPPIRAIGKHMLST